MAEAVFVAQVVTATQPVHSLSRSAGLLTTLFAFAALSVAYWAQHVRGLAPCPLCLIERWPYRVVLALGVLAVAAPPRLGRRLLAVAALVLLAGAGVAFLHVGVEHGWWPSPLPECNGILTPGAPLPAVPAIPCDRPVFLFTFLPVSFATMDMIYAAAFALALLRLGDSPCRGARIICAFAQKRKLNGTA